MSRAATMSRHAFAPFVFLLAGCSGETAGVIPAGIRDSAGVEIVVNHAPRWTAAQAWRITPEPLVEIGGLSNDPDDELFRVAGALRLDDGRLLIANGGTHELRFYDAGGSLLGRSGARGAGPGEFERLAWIRPYRGDSLLAYDSRHRRLSVFDTAGVFGRSITIESIEGVSIPLPVGPFASGAVLMPGLVLSFAAPGGSVNRSSDPLYRLSHEGAVDMKLGEYPGMEMFVRASERGVGTGSVHFSRSTTFAADRDRYFTGTNDTYQIDEHGEDGTLRRSIRIARQPIAVTDGHVASLIADRLEGIDAPDERATQRATLEDRPRAETMPAFAEIGVDRTGNLWVREYSLPGEDSRHWNVFGRDGIWLGTVEVPGGAALLDAGDDFVVVLWTDELDVEYVRVHALVKNG